VLTWFHLRLLLLQSVISVSCVVRDVWRKGPHVVVQRNHTACGNIQDPLIMLGGAPFVAVSANARQKIVHRIGQWSVCNGKPCHCCGPSNGAVKVTAQLLLKQGNKHATVADLDAFFRCRRGKRRLELHRSSICFSLCMSFRWILSFPTEICLSTTCALTPGPDTQDATAPPPSSSPVGTLSLWRCCCQQAHVRTLF
jgi:hypothetical protein